MTAKRPLVLCVLIGLAGAWCGAQDSVCRFQWQVDAGSVLNSPVSVDLEGVNWHRSDAALVLIRVQGQTRIPVPCQIDNGHTARLWFLPDKGIKPGQTCLFELGFQQSARPFPEVTAARDDKSIVLSSQGKNILQYYSAVHDVPEGVNPLYRKSGFIHPLWSPSGDVLTAIQPKDHYHHYGIWAPWTLTHVEGRKVDFWNLAAGQGTVRFAGVMSTMSGPVFAGFKVRQEHVDFTAQKGEQVAINEVLDVRAFASDMNGQPVWIVDYTSTLNNALSTPIELDAYRYGGGLGYRATNEWTHQNSEVLTSEGKTRLDADGTRARWCDITGDTQNGTRSGILFMSHTANQDYPEPMRVWPVNMPGGNVFFEFCPIRLNGWTLDPQRDYVLRYRMVIHNGPLPKETAESLWTQFVNPPRMNPVGSDKQ